MGGVERSTSDRTEGALRVGAEYVLARFSKVAAPGSPMPQQVFITAVHPLFGEFPLRLQYISGGSENGWGGRYAMNVRSDRPTYMPSSCPKHLGQLRSYTPSGSPVVLWGAPMRC